MARFTPGTSRRQNRRASAASRSAASIIAKPRPMQTRPPGLTISLTSQLSSGLGAMSDNRKITISNSLVREHNAKRIIGRGAPALRLETIAVRAGAEIDPDTGALSPPLHLSTTFEHGPASEAIHQFRYAREKNPTQLRLEAALRDLEGPPRVVTVSDSFPGRSGIGGWPRLPVRART